MYIPELWSPCVCDVCRMNVEEVETCGIAARQEVRKGTTRVTNQFLMIYNIFYEELTFNGSGMKDESDVPEVIATHPKDETFVVEDIGDRPNVRAGLADIKATKPHYLHVKFETVNVFLHMQIKILTLALLFAVASSAFLEVPNNTFVLMRESPEPIIMTCMSDCQCNLKWFAHQHHGSGRNQLYDGYILRPSARSYCTVREEEAGKYHLDLKNTAEAAQTYICFEPGSAAEVSADLIWLGDQINSDSSTKDLVNLTCSIEFRGNWAPTIEWTKQSIHGKKVLLAGVNTTRVPNRHVTSTLVMEVQEGRQNYTCIVKFDISGKPSKTTAANVPDFKTLWTSAMFIKHEGEIAETDDMTRRYTYALIISAAMVGIVIMATSSLFVIFICTKPWRKAYRGRMMLHVNEQKTSQDTPPLHFKS